MNHNKELNTQLGKELGIKNVMAIPRIIKVSLNVGMGTYLKTSKDYNEIVSNMEKISGQKPIVTQSKKAISNFKLRENMPIGVKVTLRGKRMNDFVTKLVQVILPRIRDFRGIPRTAFDGKGNYTLGLKEVLMFPEVNPDDINKTHGMEITLVTNAKNDVQGLALLKAYGFPFKKED